MEWLSDPQIWIAFLTLSVLELVLGIDNVIFISILSGKLPAEQQPSARYIGLSLRFDNARYSAVFAFLGDRSGRAAFFTFSTNRISGKDLILLIGGLFLIAKSTHEIHGSLEGEEGHASKKAYASFTSVIIQITLLDIVFSLDSVITAIGMVENIWIMIAAVVVSIVAMMLFAAPIGTFRRESSDHQNARALVFAVDRRYFGRRRFSPENSERLYLLCDGVFGVRRNSQYAAAQTRKTRRPARRIHQTRRIDCRKSLVCRFSFSFTSKSRFSSKAAFCFSANSHII